MHGAAPWMSSWLMFQSSPGTVVVRLSHVALTVVILFSAALGVCALLAVAFMMLFVWWPLAVTLTVLALIGCVWRLRVARAGRSKVAWTVASLMMLAPFLIIVSFIPGMLQHDRLMGQVSAAVCDPPLVPDGAVVRSCEGHGPENPSNGNSCGYFVELRLETSLSPSAVRAFYGSISLPPDLVSLTVTSPYADREQRSDLAHLSFLAIGDPGADPRCN